MQKGFDQATSIQISNIYSVFLFSSDNKPAQSDKSNSHHYQNARLNFHIVAS